MRRPDRARNIALGCVLLGAASFTASMTAPAGTLPGGLSGVMGVGGMTLAGLAAIFALSFAWDARGYRKLMAGEGLITQWRVDPATWQAFVAYHDKLEPLNPKYLTWHKYRRDVGDEGVEIVIGQHALIIDGDYQPLPTKRNDRHFEELSLQPGPPVFVNIHIRQDYATRSGNMRHVYYSLRLPVPDESVEEARLAISQLGQRYQPVVRRSLAQMNPLLFYRVSLVILLLCIASLAIGMSLAGKPQVLNQTAAMVMAVVGAVLGLGALFCTIVGWQMVREMKKRG